MSAAMGFRWTSLLLMCARIASCQTFLEAFKQELVRLQIDLEFDVVYECDFVQDVTHSPDVYSLCVDDGLVGGSGDMKEVVVFDWEADAAVEERCQCAEAGLVLMSKDGNVTGLCDTTSSTSIGCSVVCIGDMQCSFDQCDPNGVNEEVCVLYNRMMLSVQVQEEVIQLFFISKGVQCNVIRDFSNEICTTILDDGPLTSTDIIVLCFGLVLGAVLSMVCLVTCYCFRASYKRKMNKKQSLQKVPEGRVCATRTEIVEETEFTEAYYEQQSFVIPLERLKRYQTALAPVLYSSQDIRTVCEIGKGAFGKVERGILVTEKNGYSLEIEVAIKSLKEATPELVEDFMSECTIMLDFDHPNVLKLLGVCFEEGTNSPIILLPYMANGDLKSFLVKSRGENDIDVLPEGLLLSDLVNMCLDIAQGMKYLAELKFVHRDLAARNCMLDCDLTVKVADFGFSRDICSKDYYRLKRRTKLPVKWLAPESLFDNIYNEKTDVWSYGITCWELLSLGRVPYPGLDNPDLPEHVNSGKRLNQPPLCTDSLYDRVLQQCWLPSGRERPTFSKLVQLLEAEKRISMEIESGLHPQTPPDRPYFVLENLASVTAN